MNTSKAIRNPIAVALRIRHGNTTTSMRHKTERRSKDARKSWKRDWA